MEEATPHIRDKDINKLARNYPVAVIIGAAGFIGSHLLDHLLKLKIQVIGVDDLSSGKMENFHFASQNNNFYFYHSKIEEEQVKNVLSGLPRLDYAFFVAKNDESITLLNLGLENFLEIVSFHHERQVREHRPHTEKPKILFLSAIELHDNKRSSKFDQLETAEIFFAKYAKQNNLNARVVRLGEVFGPRMDLSQPEVFSRLIKAALENSLAGENPTQDFSTRGIYIDDAINLITKAMLLGASVNKIFDGVQLSPLKVEEIKQVLLDPKWYRQANFKFTQLPPWETPNLNRTVKELSWRPRANIIASLEETLDYFSHHQPKNDRTEKVIPIEPVDLPEEEPLLVVETPKTTGWSFREIEDPEIGDIENEKSIWPVFKFLVIWVIILLGLVYPMFVLIAGNFIIPNSLKKAESELVVGDFKSAEQEISLGYLSAKEQDNIVSSIGFLKTFGLFSQQIDSLINLSSQDVESFRNVQQTINLIDGFVTNLERGNLVPGSANQFSQNEIENEQNLANSLVKVSGFGSTVLGKVDQESLRNFYNILVGVKIANQILPNFLSGQGSESKQYLVILEDNQKARPAGGLIKGLALVKVAGGKVVDISNLSLDELDGKLPANLVPEDLIKTNLNIPNLKLSNSNFDSDFPTFAKTFQTLYLQAGGVQVDGVLSVDTKATGAILESLAGVNLDSGDKITTKAEMDVIINGGESAKKDQLLKQLLIKLFGVSRQNIFKVGQTLSEALNQKDILVFVNDPNLENKFIYNGWSGVLNQPKKSDSGVEDVIATGVYDFIGTSALKKEFNDQITINGQGLIQHKLTISFAQQGNRDFSGEIMVYLPVGVKINKLVVGANDLTGKINPFIKYGLSGVSLPLSVKLGEEQNLVLEYQLPTGLNLGQGSGNYKLDFIKQPGTDSDPLSIIFNYPEDLRVTNNLDPNSPVISGKQIQTDLLEDRQFQLTFTK